MEWLAAAGGGAFVRVSLAPGVRLLGMAARTRGQPELATGLGLLLLGGVGYPVLEVAKQARALPVDARVALLGVQMGCHAVGATAFASFHGAVSLVPLVWGGVESARYGRMLRRRLALGLAEPLVVDRLRLWSIGLFASFAVAALSTAVELAGHSLSGSVAGSLAVAAGGGVSAASLWLAFLPPRAYVRRVAARHAGRVLHA